jgi:hypothetical protein
MPFLGGSTGSGGSGDGLNGAQVNALISAALENLPPSGSGGPAITAYVSGTTYPPGSIVVNRGTVFYTLTGTSDAPYDGDPVPPLSEWDFSGVFIQEPYVFNQPAPYQTWFKTPELPYYADQLGVPDVVSYLSMYSGLAPSPLPDLPFALSLRFKFPVIADLPADSVLFSSLLLSLSDFGAYFLYSVAGPGDYAPIQPIIGLPGMDFTQGAGVYLIPVSDSEDPPLFFPASDSIRTLEFKRDGDDLRAYMDGDALSIATDWSDTPISVMDLNPATILILPAQDDAYVATLDTPSFGIEYTHPVTDWEYL